MGRANCAISHHLNLSFTMPLSWASLVACGVPLQRKSRYAGKVTGSRVLTFSNDVIHINGSWVTITQLEIEVDYRCLERKRASSHCQSMVPARRIVTILRFMGSLDRKNSSSQVTYINLQNKPLASKGIPDYIGRDTDWALMIQTSWPVSLNQWYTLDHFTFLHLCLKDSLW